MQLKKLLAIVTALLLVATLESCSQPSQIREIPAEEFAAAVGRKDVQILDVRTSTEFGSFRLKNAMHADWFQKHEYAERTRHLDRKKPVYVYCLTGIRSRQAAAELASRGFEAYNLTGGLNVWRRQGYELEINENVRQISLEDYKNLIPEKGYAVVDFGAKWCPPCKVLEPRLDALAKKHQDLFYLVKVDGGTQTDILKPLNVQSFPTLLVYKDGKEIWRKEGLPDDQEILSQMQ
jgi:rhodanese-related sulfurtransferase